VDGAVDERTVYVSLPRVTAAFSLPERQLKPAFILGIVYLYSHIFAEIRVEGV
jgi:hypothetical protein